MLRRDSIYGIALWLPTQLTRLVNESSGEFLATHWKKSVKLCAIRNASGSGILDFLSIGVQFREFFNAPRKSIPRKLVLNSPYEPEICAWTR